MDYQSKQLPFKKDLIGISKKTVEIHYDKLYQGYVAKMNEIDLELHKYALGEKEPVGNQTYSELRSLRMGETFSTNGVYLHEYYFNVLGGDGVVPDNTLTVAIKEKWKTVENFVAYFSASGMAVRGWVVLSWDMQLGRLKVYGCDSHNQGGVWGCIPLIVLDVYEHAYFMDYGADRKTYIEDFFKNMNWDVANHLFEKVNKLNLK